MIFLKPFITFILIILSFYIIGNIFEEKVKIPEESIRLRVVANSNDEYDQTIKKEVAKSLQKEINTLITTKDNVQTTKLKLKDNMNALENNINEIFNKNNYHKNYNINSLTKWNCVWCIDTDISGSYTEAEKGG